MCSDAQGPQHDRLGHHHQPTPSAFWANLRKPMPLGQKMRLVSRNLWRRVVLRHGCCDHPGEPGC